MENNQTPLGPATGYIDMLDAALLIEEPRRPYNPLRPSSAGKCERQLGFEYLEFKGIKQFEHPPMAPSQKRLLDLGSNIEYHVIKHFSKVKEFTLGSKQQQVLVTQLKDGNWITGSTDFAFWSADHKCLSDVKSKKDKHSSYYSSKWKEHNTMFQNMTHCRPLYEGAENVFWINDLISFLDELYKIDVFEAPWLERNFLQLNVYAINDFFIKQGVTHAAIIQYNKNDSTMRELRFRPSVDAAQYVIKAFHKVHDVVTETKDVEGLNRDYNLGSGPCAFCDFAKVCRPNEDTLKEHFKTYPNKSWPKKLSKMSEALVAEFSNQYKIYAEGTKLNLAVTQAEERLLKLMEQEKIWKIEFDNIDGAVYHRKEYKTPRPHFELKRTKK